MANPNNAQIRGERIAAYDTVLALFPSATDMARELSLDNRATVSHWKKRGVPIDFILVLDAVGLIHKEDLIPSVKNWDLMLSKYEQPVMNKLQTIVIKESLKKTVTTTLQTVLEPIIEEVAERTVLRVLEENGFTSEEDEDAALDDIL